jgi:hypothetical protein
MARVRLFWLAVFFLLNASKNCANSEVRPLIARDAKSSVFL